MACNEIQKNKLICYFLIKNYLFPDMVHRKLEKA